VKVVVGHIIMTTIREELTRTKRRIFIVAYAGFAVFVGGIVLGTVHGGPPHPIAIVGFFIAFAAMMSAYIILKCPKCKAHMGLFLVQSGNPFGVQKKMKFCPYCGTDIDETIEYRQ
jgi:phage FluMu protein Com